MEASTDNIEQHQHVNIEDEMKASYLDYAMSVIIGRALPDVRDGLKPVHRRILYAMYSEGLLHNRKFTKCAGVVGEAVDRDVPPLDADDPLHDPDIDPLRVEAATLLDVEFDERRYVTFPAPGFVEAIRVWTGETTWPEMTERYRADISRIEPPNIAT